MLAWTLPESRQARGLCERQETRQAGRPVSAGVLVGGAAIAGCLAQIDTLSVP